MAQLFRINIFIFLVATLVFFAHTSIATADTENKDKAASLLDYISTIYKSEGITITLVSEYPLVFKFKIKKNDLEHKKDQSNTPWIKLSPRYKGSPAQLCLFVGKPVEPHNYYRIFPMLRVNQPVRVVRLTKEFVVDRDALIPNVTDEVLMHRQLLLLKAQQFVASINTITEINGIELTLDSVPQWTNELRVNLINEPFQPRTDTTYQIEFEFTQEDPDFNSHVPITTTDALVNHLLNHHIHEEEVKDMLYNNPQPIEGCSTCTNLFEKLEDYREWRRLWNLATQSDDYLVFYMEVNSK